MDVNILHSFFGAKERGTKYSQSLITGGLKGRGQQAKSLTKEEIQIPKPVTINNLSPESNQNGMERSG
jgi:hypothetical protein